MQQQMTFLDTPSGKTSPARSAATKAKISGQCSNLSSKYAGGGYTIPLPDKGKWKHSGLIVDDGYSIAWRMLDAQFWGVPQRRKRIFLVASLRDERAGEILFEQEGVSGNSAPGTEAWQTAARYVAGSPYGGN